MAIEIRDAEYADLENIVEVHSSAGRRAYRDLFPDEYLDGPELRERQLANWSERLTSPRPDYSVRVAIADGKFIGFCAYRVDSDHVVELTALYVAPFYWSTGAGSALQRDARDAWRAAGFKMAYLWSAVDNPRAHRSYKKNGWVISEETKDEDVDGYKVPTQKLTLEL